MKRLILTLALSLFPLKQSWAALFTVDDSGDTDHGYAAGVCNSPCSLRDAIEAVNTGAGTGDTIQFNIPGGGVQTIAPTSSLPTITEIVTIDGYTQPGASPNTLTAGTNAVLLIEIDGTSAGNGVNGLTIDQGPSTIRGLAINSFDDSGIRIIQGANANIIEGNFLGTDPTGTIDLGNVQNGLGMASDGNLIGGNTPAARNILSGNNFGFQTSVNGNNLIQGNLIGTDASGTVSIGNTSAFGLSSNDNTIGGTSAAERNILSGNDNTGGLIFEGSQGNIIQGNFIGTDANGLNPLPNQGRGIVIFDSNNTLGGTSAGAGNIIAFNGEAGVEVDPRVNPATGNAILGNSIFSNGGLGILLSSGTGGDGNNNQAAPVLDSLTLSSVNGTCDFTVGGTLTSTANRTFRIEFFSNQALDPSGFGEGQTFLSFLDVTTDGTGQANFSLGLQSLLTDFFITATATDLTTNDSSQFSNGIANVGAVQFQSANFSVSEDAGDASIIVTRVCGNLGEITVQFATSDGTAVGGEDYTPVNTTVTFADGDSADQIVSVPILLDASLEVDETVNLTLSSPTAGAILAEPFQAILTILANGGGLPPPSLSGGGCQLGPLAGGNYLSALFLFGPLGIWLIFRIFRGDEGPKGAQGSKARG